MTLYPEELINVNSEEEESVEPLTAGPTLTKAHVQTLPVMDYANPNKYTLPAPPAGLTWIYMSQCLSRHDIVRINGLS